MMGKYVMGVDLAYGDDYSCYQVWKKPSRLRLFFRRIGLDKSTWERKLVKEWFV